MNYAGISLFVFALLIIGCDGRPLPQPSEQLVMINPLDKIWAHRVNHTDILEQRLSEYKGIEIDVFYEADSDRFIVKHDLDSTGPDLEEFIDSTLNIRIPLIWIDYKNLDQNTESGISKLTEIVSSKSLRNHVFVESYHTNQLLQFDQRVQTSCWVGSNPIPETKIERDQLFESEYRKFKGLKVEFLSSSFEMFEFLTSYFPEYQVNLWMSGELDSARVELLRTMADIKNVNIILIDGNKNPLKAEK